MIQCIADIVVDMEIAAGHGGQSESGHQVGIFTLLKKFYQTEQTDSLIYISEAITI